MRAGKQHFLTQSIDILIRSIQTKVVSLQKGPQRFGELEFLSAAVVQGMDLYKLDLF